MMSPSRREFDALLRKVDRLEQELAKRPIRHPAGGSPSLTYRIAIDGGNTLATGQSGIKYQSSPVTNVPSAYDPTVTSSFIDGIGRGTLYINGVSQGYVLVILDSVTASIINFDLLGGATDGDLINTTAVLRSLTVGGDPLVTVNAYAPDFI